MLQVNFFPLQVTIYTIKTPYICMFVSMVVLDLVWELDGKKMFKEKIFSLHFFYRRR